MPCNAVLRRIVGRGPTHPVDARFSRCSVDAARQTACAAPSVSAGGALSNSCRLCLCPGTSCPPPPPPSARLRLAYPLAGVRVQERLRAGGAGSREHSAADRRLVLRQVCTLAWGAVFSPRSIVFRAEDSTPRLRPVPRKPRTATHPRSPGLRPAAHRTRTASITRRSSILPRWSSIRYACEQSHPLSRCHSHGLPSPPSTCYLCD